jgi:tyrosine-protein kinase Etk/Wzc
LKNGKNNLSVLDSVDGEFGILDLLLVLARYKKGIIVFLAISVLSALLASQLMPDLYVASAKLLPPQQTQANSIALVATLGVALGGKNSLPDLKGKGDLYAGILKTRAVADALISTFDLKKVYGLDSLERTRMRLAANTTIVATKDGFIDVAVQDHSKIMAMKLTNGYVAELDRVLRTASAWDAAQRRKFFGRELSRAGSILSVDEMNLKESLESTGFVDVTAAGEGMIATVAEIRKSISEKKVQLEAIESFVTSQNPSYARPQAELLSLQQALATLEAGQGGTAERSTPAANEHAGLKSVIALREANYSRMLYQLLQKQYELARLDESDTTSLIQILDAATLPDSASKPQRGLFVLLVAVASMIIALAGAFVAEAKSRRVELRGQNGL